MVKQNNRHFVRKAIKRPELDILCAGEATVYGDWHGEVISSQYSRLYFILEGGFYIESTVGERTELSVGRAYLVPSGYSYSFGCESEARHIYFHIRLSDYDSIDILSRLEKPTSVTFSLDGERLSRMLRTDGIESSLLIESEIMRAITELSLSKSGSLSTPSYSKSVSCAIDYISENLSVQLSVSEIADAVYIAKSTLSVTFRRETGMSIGEYIDYRVMLSAVKQLLATRRKILDISDSLGFCDQFYFSRRFKEKYGVSPREFRRLGFIG